jgi:hypothetical protein
MEMAASPLLYKAKMGAYTGLWAGLAPELGLEMNGGCVMPWGRVHPAPRADLMMALKGEAEGGTGQAGEFVEWVEKQVKEFR